MPEKEPLFTVTDRRKFTTAGELRPGFEATEAPPVTPAPAPTAASDEFSSVVTPAREAAAPVAVSDPMTPPDPGEADEVDDFAAGDDDGMLPEPTAREAAEQQAAYKESARTLDDLIARQNPKARAAGEMTFDRLVQSIYMTAAIQLGAGAQPGEQPRVDIMGARQSIDMLSTLTEKTKGNLTANEERLLQNAVFELRMSFLEITNAIATSAQNPAGPAGVGPGGPGGRSSFRPGGGGGLR